MLDQIIEIVFYQLDKINSKGPNGEKVPGCLSSCSKKKYELLPKAISTLKDANTCHAKVYWWDYSIDLKNESCKIST